ncbi:slit protein putative [Clonorchis sinensis]|uniref:Slit protein putative n=1 Tax=Clonorchis sinensis TaxID=79923 RepID=G7YHG9_CLOSI|nr:slit protein putative [Clonorchis sinensis]
MVNEKQTPLRSQLVFNVQLTRHLRGNQFRCDCSVRPLIENFLRTNRLDILIRSGATCYMPDGTTRLGQRALDARLLSTLECSANDERYVRPPMMCTPKTSVSCSTVCDCSMDRAANCQRHELTSVPQDLPREIMELLFGMVKLTDLHRANATRYDIHLVLDRQIYEFKQIPVVATRTLCRTGQFADTVPAQKQNLLLTTGVIRRPGKLTDTDKYQGIKTCLLLTNPYFGFRHEFLSSKNET